MSVTLQTSKKVPGVSVPGWPPLLLGARVERAGVPLASAGWRQALGNRGPRGSLTRLARPVPAARPQAD